MTQAMPHPLRESMSKHNITRVAVVDDAYDPVSLSSFQEGEDREFIDAVNEDDVLLREFHRVATGAESNRVLIAADLTDEIAGRLWQDRETLNGLKAVAGATLFRVHDTKVSQVTALFKFLKDVLGIPLVKTYGTQLEMPEEEFDLAFVDYRFGPSREDASVERAVRWATHLYKKGRTFIILMSAEPEGMLRQDVFRNKSELTRGLFEFVAKDEIEDSGKFCNRLKSFCAGLSTRHKIHDFAAAGEAAADESLKALKESIHSLGIEDYAYLEQISLREDGHPLGDYMLWLFGGYFAHRLAVNQSLQSARSSVNGLKYENFLPLQRPPSVMLATMYSAAITEPIFEGWGPHPRDLPTEATPAVASPETQSAQEATGSAAVEPPQGPQPTTPAATVAATNAVQPSGIADTAPAPVTTQEEVMPFFQLGDLLVASKDKPAYLVINAGCDLQFSPGTKRSCDIDQSILLIPGQFELLHERGEEISAKRTELYELQGERFRVIWQHTRVKSFPHKSVRQEFEPKGYKRQSRLKLPYALEVQQHFAMQLTRVGVPTPTPVFREYPIVVYGKAADGTFLNVGTVSNGVVVFHHKENDQFVLTVDCINEVLNIIDHFAARVEEEIQADGAIGAVNVAGTSQPQAAASSAPGTPPRRGGENVVRDAGQEAATRARRRKKYLDELRASRDALSRNCRFQDSLCKLPAIDESEQHIDTISDTEKLTRIEVRHATSLSGKFVGNAPIILAFALPKATNPAQPEVGEVSMAGIVQQQANGTEGAIATV